MSTNTWSNINISGYREVPFQNVIILSVIIHIILLIGIPLAAKFLWKPKKFTRPQTFQLVSIPSQYTPQRRLNTESAKVKQRIAQREVKPEPARVPSPNAAKVKSTKAEKSQEAAKPVEENLNELESLLDELPVPTQASSLGDFPYPWYLRNMEQKVKRFWSPSEQNNKIFVVISFVVHRDGSASDIRIVQSSGNNNLDNMAIRAVTLASPFGRMPPGFGGELNEFSLKLHPTTN